MADGLCPPCISGFPLEMWDVMTARVVAAVCAPALRGDLGLVAGLLLGLGSATANDDDQEQEHDEYQEFLEAVAESGTDAVDIIAAYLGNLRVLQGEVRRRSLAKSRGAPRSNEAAAAVASISGVGEAARLLLQRVAEARAVIRPYKARHKKPRYRKAAAGEVRNQRHDSARLGLEEGAAGDSSAGSGSATSLAADHPHGGRRSRSGASSVCSNSGDEDYDGYEEYDDSDDDDGVAPGGVDMPRAHGANGAGRPLNGSSAQQEQLLLLYALQGRQGAEETLRRVAYTSQQQQEAPAAHIRYSAVPRDGSPGRGRPLYGATAGAATAAARQTQGPPAPPPPRAMTNHLATASGPISPGARPLQPASDGSRVATAAAAAAAASVASGARDAQLQAGHLAAGQLRRPRSGPQPQYRPMVSAVQQQQAAVKAMHTGSSGSSSSLMMHVAPGAGLAPGPTQPRTRMTAYAMPATTFWAKQEHKAPTAPGGSWLGHMQQQQDQQQQELLLEQALAGPSLMLMDARGQQDQLPLQPSQQQQQRGQAAAAVQLQAVAGAGAGAPRPAAWLPAAASGLAVAAGQLHGYGGGGSSVAMTPMLPANAMGWAAGNQRQQQQLQLSRGALSSSEVQRMVLTGLEAQQQQHQHQLARGQMSSNEAQRLALSALEAQQQLQQQHDNISLLLQAGAAGLSAADFAALQGSYIMVPEEDQGLMPSTFILSSGYSQYGGSSDDM